MHVGLAMPKRIVIIQGHPDTAPNRFCRVLARTYEESARGSGHEVRLIDVAELNFELLRSQLEWQGSKPAPDIERALHAVERHADRGPV